MTTTLSAATAGAERAMVPPFAVISGAQVQRVLHGREREIVSWSRPRGSTVRGIR
jgi:hypothetical protein